MKENMNEKITQLLRSTIESNGIKYTYISKQTKIDYQRLMRIFNQNAIISGSELICLCKTLKIEQSKLMELIADT